MKRRILLIMMILAMVLTMAAGCGEKAEEEIGISGVLNENFNEKENDTPSEEDPSEEQEEPAGEDPKEPSDEEPTVKDEPNEEPNQEPTDDPEEDPTDEPSKEPEQQPSTPSEEPKDEGPKDADGYALPAEGIDYSDGYIKVMSYNIKHLGSQSQNMEKLVEYLKEADPDIVGFQEVDNGHSRSGRLNQIKEIAEKCGYPYYHFGKNIDIDGGGEYGNAFISKYPIKESTVVNFNAVAADDHNRSYSRYELDVNGTTLCVYNMHGTLDGSFDYRLIGAEVNQMFKAAEKDEYAVLMGDFNLQAQHMPKFVDTDKFMILNGGLDYETFLFTYSSSNPTSSIDNIMVSRNLEYYWNHTTGVGCETDKLPDISDHNPIYTWIKIPE